jgi:hypothetical protein
VCPLAGPVVNALGLQKGPDAAEKSGVLWVLVNYLVTSRRRMVRFHSARLRFEQLMVAEMHCNTHIYLSCLLYNGLCLCIWNSSIWEVAINMLGKADTQPGVATSLLPLTACSWLRDTLCPQSSIIHRMIRITGKKRDIFSSLIDDASVQ